MSSSGQFANEEARDILLAGISHDLHRQINSISVQLEEWTKKRGQQLEQALPGRRGRLSEIANGCGQTAKTLMRIVNDADDDAYGNVSDMLRDFEQKITKPLRNAAKELRNIANEHEPSARSGMMIELKRHGRGYERAAELLDSLSKFAAIDSKPKYERVNFGTELESIIWDLRGIFEREKVQWDAVRLTQARQVTIVTDRGLFSAIASNLISNAVVHTRPHRLPTIDVVCQLVTSASVEEAFETANIRGLKLGSDTVWACLRVADNGPGIPIDSRKSVFQVFKQGSIARRTGKGSGVGLALVHYALQVLDGAVRVSASKRGGAEFTVWLPSGPSDNLPQHVLV